MKKRIKTLNVIRSFLSLPIFIVLLVMLIAGSLALGVLTTFMDSSNTKDWIEGTGVYDEAPDLIVGLAYSKIEDIQNERGLEETDPLDGFMTESQLKERVREAFPPEWIKETVEGVIDSAYDSLNNPAGVNQITLDLSDREGKIREVLGDIFKSKVSALPDCSSEVEGGLDTFNLIEANCLPQNINRDQAYDLIDNQVAQIAPLDDVGLQEIRIGGEGSLDSGGEGGGIKNLVDKLPIALAVFVGLALVLHLALYFLFPGRRGKLIVFSFLWVITAVTLMLVTIAMFVGFDFAYGTYIGSNIPPEAAVAAPFAEKILMAIRTSIAWKLGLISLVFACLGALMGYKLGSNK